ncbi:hypothetical protein KAFR_0A01130 [Kazachstania africana CBS 2517]|uniref:Glycosyltransferase family 15 protein n=1 Tax=Kazachstania africana (strain ATCC 22294 / BCRC 22015 / CBS 2517 / CECT 1963 / NBRC 1671 / NRRL Y-8276) TaxID=1071382 RepID=H2AMF2_KAZAF|nr:hypothetical protein KAFR_0A01130 [Kazachstania africana CBS 2517]CCF55552.1 hypothetical protein KAFR_0A01130 [Kazachstania africana CBS 2517]
MHQHKRNAKFVLGTIVVLVFIFTIYRSGRSSTAPITVMDMKLEQEAFSTDDETSENPSLTSPVSSQDALEEEELRVKQEIINERKKSKYDKFGYDTVQGSMVASFANFGYRPNAVLIQFISNADLNDVIASLKSVENKFNKWYNYPWLFVSVTGEEFDDLEFMEEVKSITNDNISFEIVNDDWFWSYPDWIDMNKISDSRVKLSEFPNGDSNWFRHYSRYFTGFFYQEPYMRGYDWYWKIEPGMELLCDLDIDLFRWMQDNEVAFSFIASFKESKELVENLGQTVKKFVEKFPDYVDSNNFIKFLCNDNDCNNFNLCQFDENFQIANLNFFRSKTFEEFFRFLDVNGGIYYNRWSTGAIQTVAASLFLPKKQIKFFDYMGYAEKDSKFYNCPTDNDLWKNYNCDCDPGLDFTFHKDSCTAKYYDIMDIKKPDNWDKH